MRDERRTYKTKRRVGPANNRGSETERIQRKKKRSRKKDGAGSRRECDGRRDRSKLKKKKPMLSSNEGAWLYILAPQNGCFALCSCTENGGGVRRRPRETTYGALTKPTTLFSKTNQACAGQRSWIGRQRHWYGNIKREGWDGRRLPTGRPATRPRGGFGNFWPFSWAIAHTFWL